MNQPLGYAVGNALELIEAIETLKGNGPKDFTSHCIDIASLMLVAGNKAETREEAVKVARMNLESGRAFEKFSELVSAQGGDLRFIDDTGLLPKAAVIKTVEAPQSGYLSTIDAREVGETTVEMGAGRVKKGDDIDHSVGVIIHHKVGDYVEKGQPLFTIHASSQESFTAARIRLLAAHLWSSDPVKPLPHIHEILG
jgi:pyrimidine-nucleoside phosphorylase